MPGTSKLLTFLLLTVGTRSLLVYGQGPAGLSTVVTVDALLNQPGGIRYLDAHHVVLPSAEGAGYYDVLQRVDSAGLNWQLRRYSLPAKRLVLAQFFTGVLPQ
jgi:hypothetical protein